MGLRAHPVKNQRLQTRQHFPDGQRPAQHTGYDEPDSALELSTSSGAARRRDPYFAFVSRDCRSRSRVPIPARLFLCRDFRGAPLSPGPGALAADIPAPSDAASLSRRAFACRNGPLCRQWPPTAFARPARFERRRRMSCMRRRWAGTSDVTWLPPWRAAWGAAAPQRPRLPAAPGCVHLPDLSAATLRPSRLTAHRWPAGRFLFPTQRAAGVHLLGFPRAARGLPRPRPLAANCRGTSTSRPGTCGSGLADRNHRDGGDATSSRRCGDAARRARLGPRHALHRRILYGPARPRPESPSRMDGRETVRERTVSRRSDTAKAGEAGRACTQRRAPRDQLRHNHDTTARSLRAGRALIYGNTVIAGIVIYGNTVIAGNIGIYDNTVGNTGIVI